MKLRPYQKEGVTAVLSAFETGDSAIMSWATGLGKTLAFCEVIRRMLTSPGDRAIILAHRQELLEQAGDKVTRLTGFEHETEKAEQYADRQSSGLLRWRAPVILTSVQTQVASRGDGFRMDRFEPNDFKLLIVDEAHHATANSYRAVIEHYRQNPKLKLLGVTATPNRHDEESLGQLFGVSAHEMGLLDGIIEGWLVGVSSRQVYVDSLDLSNVPTSCGDLNGRELARVMEYEQTLHGVVQPTIELAGDRKTLVFAASVAQADRMAQIFNRHQPGSAAFVCGKTPQDDRDGIMAAFRNGRIQRLVNCGVATEGFDVPDIGCVAIARPTKSQPLYQQMAGRGTRVLASLDIDQYETAHDRLAAIRNSKKPDLLLLDFVGNSGQHTLMSAVDVLGGTYSDDVLAIARDALLHKDAVADVREVLEEAEKLERERSKMKRDAESTEEQRRRRGIRPGVAFKTKSVNPFDVYDIDVKRVPAWSKDRVPTPGQINALTNFGVREPELLTFSAASQLLDTLCQRADAGKCRVRQAAILKRRGYPIDCSFEEASLLIGKIAEREGWNR